MYDQRRTTSGRMLVMPPLGGSRVCLYLAMVRNMVRAAILSLATNVAS